MVDYPQSMQEETKGKLDVKRVKKRKEQKTAVLIGSLGCEFLIL